MRPGERGTLTVLHSFFRIAAPVFLGLSMLFTPDSNGVLWVMWRDNTLLAATLASIGLLMGAGWCAVNLESVLEFRGLKNLSDDATVVAVGITS